MRGRGHARGSQKDRGASLSQIDLLVLNYNGRALLAECLPSIIAAARASTHDCRVVVVDNSSRDGSRELLAAEFPEVDVVCRPNRCLCSFNDVLRHRSAPVAILLNNDVSLAPGAVDPLVEPLIAGGETPVRRVFMTAPRCWSQQGHHYEGFKTSIRWRFGLVQATALFPGHERAAGIPGPTASAGAVIAVDRQVFLELGGFDPIYLPGRIEDLDLAFRAHQAGFDALYVPSAHAYHLGHATFGKVLGDNRSHALALRNTLIFQWRNLRHPAHVLRMAWGLGVRLARDVVAARSTPAAQRWAFTRIVAQAMGCYRKGAPRPAATRSWSREREFFRSFHPRRMAAVGSRAQVVPSVAAAPPPAPHVDLSPSHSSTLPQDTSA